MHICREGESEREKNSTKLIQQNFAEDMLFKCIENASPQIKHKTIIHSINPKNYQETNRRNTNTNTSNSFQQSPLQLKQYTTNNSFSNNNNLLATNKNSMNNYGIDKKGLMFAGVFQDLIKISPIKKQDGNGIIKPLSQREESGKGTDTSKTSSNIEDDDEEKNSDLSSDNSSYHKDRDFSYVEEENDVINNDIHKKKKRRDNAKGVFDLLDEVNDDSKNKKLADKYLEFNRSFIYNQTNSSH